ncbi:interleukin-13 receptor subunit alpha-2-like [Leucoraja erinacea]|uniref:interleukin-13 receptor subunit alpha-2-like n=1 Tax=Leucoraja erinaceus TaxID=7782 RepID=UPI002458145B|nr:interleukin-13 receptor subunit alpha-2-like [Leucoraja erinacea]
MGLNILAILLPALILWPSRTSAALTVDPPTDLQIIDPGHLGPLHIHWKAPLSLTSEKSCMVRYMLTYCDVDSTNCKRIITRQLKHTDGFNLNKGVIVKVRTLVKEHCDGSELKSDWMEMTYWPLIEGLADSKIKNLQCIVYNLEYMDCLWKNGANAPNDTDYRLYYWHEELEQVMKCNNYIKNQGHKVGCHFSNDSLIEFSDFNICINGTSRLGPVMPTYYTFQLQDHVKPAAPYEIKMTASKNGIYLEWKPPAGKIKPHCLEYEVNFSGKNTDWESKVLPEETTSTFLNITVKTKFCVHLRAAVNMYCADDSVWSEWSSTQCLRDYPAEEEHTIIKRNLFSELILLTALASISLTLLVGVLACWVRWKRSFSKKKVNMLLTEETKSINERNCLNC